MKRLLALAMLVAACSGSSRPVPSPTADPIAQAEIHFSGHPSQDIIRTKLNQAFAIYGLTATPGNYSRATDYLHTLTMYATADGYPDITEIAILDAMAAGGRLRGMTFEQAAQSTATQMRGKVP